MQALWGDEAAVEVGASPERVWGLVSDVTRMGEWSPVCRRCEWMPGSDRPVVGGRFVGHNRQTGLRWSRECEVTAVEPGREFAFRTYFKGDEATRWRYQFEAVPAGTRVVESYQVVSLPRWVRLLHRIPGAARWARRDAVRNMEETLRRLKSAAEEE